MKNNIFLYAVFGMLWGWTALGVNALTGAFTLESSLIHNLITFAIGGAIFSVVAGGVLSLLSEWLPLKNVYLKAVFVSAIVWGILMAGGVILSLRNPERYEIVKSQSAQGLVLACIMGCLLGFLTKIKQEA